MEVEERYQ